MLGGPGEDELYAGTGVDFMYGDGGTDVLYNTYGERLDAEVDAVADEAWKEYAQQSDKVWYYRGTNADDVISVDFVTEPGLLADHHLITRLTDNDGNYTFNCADPTGFPGPRRGWRADLGSQRGVIQSRCPQYPRSNGSRNRSYRPSLPRTQLSELLPSEGDYLVILIDALGGARQVTVGPTVQRTVWIDAGSGDDRVEILSGNTLLPDQSEQSHRNDDPETAFDLTTYDGGSAMVSSRSFTGLTSDNPDNVDFYRFTVGPDLTRISLNSTSQDDGLTMALLQADSLVPVNDVATPPLLFVPDSRDANGSSNNIPDDAYFIPGIEGVGIVRGLTLHQSDDEDWFKFQLPDLPAEAQARVTLKRLEGGEISLGLCDAEARRLKSVTVASNKDTLQLDMSGYRRGTYLLKVDGGEPAQYELHFSIGTAGNTLLDFSGEGRVGLVMPDDFEPGMYLLRVSSANFVPTIYDVTFQIGEDPATAVDLAARADALRRDIILGGPGNDILSGGPSEDWSSAAWVTTC